MARIDLGQVSLPSFKIYSATRRMDRLSSCLVEGKFLSNGGSLARHPLYVATARLSHFTIPRLIQDLGSSTNSTAVPVPPQLSPESSFKTSSQEVVAGSSQAFVRPQHISDVFVSLKLGSVMEL
jgi:hypothetical protein